MKLIKYIFILFVISIPNFSFANDDANIKLINKISKNLRCLICQGQSIYDSQSDFSESIKILIKKKINEGKSEKEIYKFLKNKYGDWIVYEPSFSKHTYFLWLFPLILFIFGGILILRKKSIN
jgi:cytochrome c-type biogenesis protein CcmH|tara:strand:+ start:344 stop:712 length:369 start_codon:yes stop_codon:yes gene_type:complete